MNNKVLLVVVSVLALIGAFYYGSQAVKRSQHKQAELLAKQHVDGFVREHSPQFGNPDAPIYLVEFLDPECETCRQFYPIVKNIIKDYDGKVQLIIRYAPFHANSISAVKALEAARKQGKYWQALEVLFENQPAWASHHDPRPELKWDFLARVGVDVEKAKVQMNDQYIAEIVRQDMEDLKKLEVQKTPSFFVNGEPLLEFGEEPLRALIDQQLAKAQAGH